MANTRACDRCWAAKTQCDGTEPCTRCVRLRVECLSERPRKKRGRPGKSNTTTRRTRSTVTETAPVSDEVHLEHTDSVTEPEVQASPPAILLSISPITTARDPVSTSGPPTSPVYSSDAGLARAYPDSAQNATGQHLFTPLGTTTADIDQFLTALHCSSLAVGFLSPLKILLAAPDWQLIPDGNKNALMALSLQLDYHSHDVSHDQGVEPQLLIDSCRIQALSSIPALVWQSCDMIIDHVVILFSFSFTWCMKTPLVDIAYRWNNLAELVWSDLRQSYWQRPDFDRSLCRCLDLVLTLQNLTLRLLVPKVGANQSVVKPSSMVPAQTLTADQSSPSSSTGPNFANNLVEDFIQLFEPFIEPLTLILNRNPSNNYAAYVQEILELYYIDFPSRLLAFSAVTHIYQAEAMIWLHGIHILACAREDLIDIIFGEALLSSTAFYNCYEHTILMIEVMPALFRIDPELKLTSTATIYFLILAGTVLCAALVQFHAPIEPTGCTELLPSAPAQLLQIAGDYAQALNTVAQMQSRFDTDLAGAVSVLIVSIQQGMDERAVDAVNRALHVMTHYRWRGNGKGIVPLSDEDTRLAWNYPSIDLEKDLRLPIPSNNADNSNRRDWIARLTSWESRVCKRGYFDLSIQFL